MGVSDKVSIVDPSELQGPPGDSLLSQIHPTTASPFKSEDSPGSTAALRVGGTRDCCWGNRSDSLRGRQKPEIPYQFRELRMLRAHSVSRFPTFPWYTDSGTEVHCVLQPS
jgi:hypothetical protein